MVLAGPTEGPTAPATAAIASGVELALAGRDVRIVRLDDRCDRTRAVEAATEAAALSPDLVIGHPCPSAAIAAAQVYAASGILFIAPATRHPALTSGRNRTAVLRIAGRDDHQGRDAGRYLARLAAGRRVALLSDRTRYGLSIVADAEAMLKATGEPSPLVAHLASAERDYAALLARLADSKIAVIFFAGAPQEAAILRRQMREAGLDIPFLGSDAIADPVFPQRAGDATEGTLVMQTPDPKGFPGAADVLAKLAARGETASLESLQAHAAIEGWLAAIATGAPASGPRPRGAELAELIRRRMPGTILGPLAFSANGDAEFPSFAVYVWRAGNLVQLDAVRQGARP
ncbi:MAG TPA: branched-chain amino acid ABC transporter substrate-binding protein [Hyphomicrobiaceae bacterium]|nr:branched-chain amino acid ABC transporter substrate-binding protein [Hyphomicrobiaceae bacterium]